MTESTLAYITPVSEDGPVDPGRPSRPGGTPEHPIVLPPLPPDPGVPTQPLPPISGLPSHPIVIPPVPEHPIAVPPGTIWPPIPPGSGITGKTLILIYVFGVGHRWLVVDGPDVWPPQPQPKR